MKDNWIKCTDRLPETEDVVLVFTMSGNYDFAWFNKNEQAWFDMFRTIEVTHWQKLEKP